MGSVLNCCETREKHINETHLDNDTTRCSISVEHSSKDKNSRRNSFLMDKKLKKRYKEEDDLPSVDESVITSKTKIQNKDLEEWQRVENNKKINKLFRKRMMRNDNVTGTFVRGVF